MTDKPTAISATRRQYKEMADGTLRVTLDIDPPQKQAFLYLFPNIDMPVALAPLREDFEQHKEPVPLVANYLNLPKGGELSKLAARWCKDSIFWNWCSSVCKQDMRDELEARTYILTICRIDSRAELDHNEEAAKIFHERIRKPYSEYLRSIGGSASEPI